MTIPGVGPVTASAIVATIQDVGEFASGRADERGGKRHAQPNVTALHLELYAFRSRAGSRSPPAAGSRPYSSRSLSEK